MCATIRRLMTSKTPCSPSNVPLTSLNEKINLLTSNLSGTSNLVSISRTSTRIPIPVPTHSLSLSNPLPLSPRLPPRTPPRHSHPSLLLRRGDRVEITANSRQDQLSRSVRQCRQLRFICFRYVSFHTARNHYIQNLRGVFQLMVEAKWY